MASRNLPSFSGSTISDRPCAELPSDGLFSLSCRAMLVENVRHKAGRSWQRKLKALTLPHARMRADAMTTDIKAYNVYVSTYEHQKLVS
jgi:hypothetical protein